MCADDFSPFFAAQKQKQKNNEKFNELIIKLRETLAFFSEKLTGSKLKLLLLLFILVKGASQALQKRAQDICDRKNKIK